jgi:CBS domain-containing protein
MTIDQLISSDVPPLQPADTVEHALGLIVGLRVRHLPVVDTQGVLVGIISEEQLLDATGPDELVDGLIKSKPIFAAPNQHVFDAAKILVQHGLSTLPVATPEGRYLGLVRRHDIVDRFAHMLSTHEAGAIVALEIDTADYSLSRLVYAVEQTDVRILSISTEASDGRDGVTAVTLKLNTSDITRVRHVLEHEGYRVVAVFSDDEDEEDFRHRIQEFMRYLEV